MTSRETGHRSNRCNGAHAVAGLGLLGRGECAPQPGTPVMMGRLETCGESARPEEDGRTCSRRAGGAQPGRARTSWALLCPSRPRGGGRFVGPRSAQWLVLGGARVGPPGRRTRPAHRRSSGLGDRRRDARRCNPTSDPTIVQRRARRRRCGSTGACLPDDLSHPCRHGRLRGAGLPGSAPGPTSKAATPRSCGGSQQRDLRPLAHSSHLGHGEGQHRNHRPLRWADRLRSDNSSTVCPATLASSSPP